jgi:folate-binding Fe-S cluster repair protein YgfZ
LITNDLRELKEKKVEDLKIERIALFTLFLQPKGKVLTDAFIFRPRVY